MQERPLKTKNSYRKVLLNAETALMLRNRHIADSSESEYIFPAPNGGPMEPDCARKMLKRILKRAGLEEIRFHDLRHTFAMLALQNGVDVKTLSGILGHYSAAFTLDTYGHISTQMQEDAANKIGSFLAQKT